MTEYSPQPTCSGGSVKIRLDMPNYAAKFRFEKCKRR